jgi:ribosome biogenesis GTPase / thiamine phosphate phosphatase
MNITDLGLDDYFTGCFKEFSNEEFSLGRVIREHRERYIVSDGENEYNAEVTGNLRFSASSRSDFPAVGDWVVMKTYEPDQAIIHKVLPRKTILSRQAVSKFGEIQIISANIDVAFIVQAINNNFNINRLERYLSICYSAGIEPVLVLSKTDLSTEEEIQIAISELEKRDRNVRYILMSNITMNGLAQVMALIQKEKTYCVVGSSGVGKSTLINNLLKKNIIKTGQISSNTNKGKHVTEHRELFVLENGGIIIDTPGMKELGMTDDSEGIKTTFQDIAHIASKCRFQDCLHICEKGCAVIDAVNRGDIDRDSYENFLKVRREQERFQISASEKKRKEKIFGKIIKNYFKDRGTT